MLKLSLLLSLLALISCGKDKPMEQPDNIGVRWELQEAIVADPNVLQKIGAICESLTWKASRLQVGSQYSFTYVHKGCTDLKTTPMPDVNVTLQKFADVFTFVSINT